PSRGCAGLRPGHGESGDGDRADEKQAGLTAMSASALKFAVFDCDGTLVDSQHHIVAAAQAAFARHDLPPPPAEMVRTGIGLPLRQALARLAPDGDDALHDGLTEAYKAVFFEMR